MDKDISKDYGTEKINMMIFSPLRGPLGDWIDRWLIPCRSDMSTYQNILWMAGRNGLFRADCGTIPSGNR
ncbi:MAG: hypothetical protein ACLU4J_05405 [Butyricimonas paravirosa]